MSSFSLVFETSTPHASLARISTSGIIEQRGFHSDRNHNAMLFAPLTELFQDSAGAEISIVLVGSGPGSYSGTRVGIAAAQGVAIARDCPAIAVPSILAVPSAHGGAACLAIGDARRGSYWTAMMEQSRLIAEPALCDAAELACIITSTVSQGIPVVSFEAPDRFPLPPELAAHVRLEFPDATRLWHVWQESDDATRRHWQSCIPQPIYLKPPHITPGKTQSLLKA